MMPLFPSFNISDGYGYNFTPPSFEEEYERIKLKYGDVQLFYFIPEHHKEMIIYINYIDNISTPDGYYLFYRKTERLWCHCSNDPGILLTNTNHELPPGHGLYIKYNDESVFLDQVSFEDMIGVINKFILLR